MLMSPQTPTGKLGSADKDVQGALCSFNDDDELYIGR